MAEQQKNEGKPSPPAQKSWLRRNAVTIAMLVLVLGMTIGLFIFRNQIVKLGDYGYLGTFILSVATNATILLPMPSILMMLPLGAAFNPLYIGLVAGLGGAIGEMTAYIIGYTGRGIWNDNPNYIKAVGWLKRWGMLIVFLFSVTPMPLDLMGIAAGTLRLPAWKFFLPCWPGKTIKYTILAYVGYWGWDAFIKNQSLQASLLTTTIALLTVMVVLAAALVLENLTWGKRPQKR
jgi:membrane protein YqaA with SNARE-associated domain